VLDSTELNSSVNIGTSGLGTCTCCHQNDLVQPHWDHPGKLLCKPCLALLFTFEANGDLAHLSYAYWVNVLGGAQ
jgi:hypothetical protein